MDFQLLATMLGLVSLCIAFPLYVLIHLIFERKRFTSPITVNLDLILGVLFMACSLTHGLAQDATGMCLWLINSVMYLSSGFWLEESCKPTL